ncbi:Origin recognition complex subunit 5 [Vanrija pseudolonga]|uniref:Origin recognition complex subunit 5 n=1 Tax=Vanrija pseudolonga TaxID=143232 RepID=A0AAF1BKA1_9TREE|nr:Origin recognition complex subunit 5 [Vanrija pseudolonga]
METLATLLAHDGSPPLVYLHHPHHSASAVRAQLPPVAAEADLIELHTPRLLYAGVLARVAASRGAEREGEVATWDAFVRGLREVCSTRTANGASAANGSRKGKGRAIDDLDADASTHLVLVFTRAERLKSVLGPIWTALTRLSELANLPATVVLASALPWDDVRPARSDAVEPVMVYLDPIRRDELRDALLLSGSTHPLYPRFVDLLLASLGQLAPPSEVAFAADSLWPLYTATLPAHAEQELLGRAPPEPDTPPLSVSVKLLTDLKHQLSLALSVAAESLLPRTVGKADFIRALNPLSSDGTPRPLTARAIPRPPGLDLPLAAQFLLVAAYCASYNPAKSDVRLFGRGTGPDGKRRRGGGVRRAGYGRTRVGKVPQRLLGPKAFPLDRLLAMFASLYAEHAARPEDLESDGEVAVTAAQIERKRARHAERDEQWEDEVDALAMSVGLWSLIPELEAQSLLKRTSPVDRLDNIMLRCEIDYEGTKTLAKGLKITLDEYLYEAMA